jgi:molybdate transport system substrate-binding protein
MLLALPLLLASVASAEDLTVFAAASLTDALQEIGGSYRNEAGTAVGFSFGASSDLARQIVAGAPADVFFSADTARMDAVEKAGLVAPGDRVDLLSNILVVIEGAGATSRLAVPADLGGVRRLALADPEAVPAGVYARKWLESIGLWERLQQRVVPLLDVRAALAAVASGNADAAIVYRTDAALSKRVRIAFEVPKAEGPSIAYVVAAISSSRNPAARAFVKRLRAAETARVFEKHGFIVLGPK